MGDSLSNNKLIAKNTVFLTVRMVFVMCVYIYTSRVILNTLGVEDYGTYNVIGGFVSMFGFLSLSIANGIQRFYNYERGKKGEAAVTKVYNAALFLLGVLAVIIFILLETFGLWYLDNKMVLPAGRELVAFWLFQFSVVASLVTMMQIPFSAAIMSYEKMGYYALVNVFDVLMNLVIAASLPFFTIDHLFMYGALTFCRTVLVFVLYFMFCKRHFKVMRFSRMVDRPLLKEVLVFSGWNICGTFGATIRDQGTNMVLNLFFGPVVNAARGVATQVTGAVQSFVANVGIAVRPQLTSSYAQGNKEHSFKLMFSLSKISFAALYVMALPIMVDINYILKLWLGDVVPEHTATFITISFMLGFLNAFNAAFSAIIHSSGKMKWYQITGALCNVLILPASYVFLLKGCTPEFALWVSVVFVFLNQVIALFILRKQEGMEIGVYCKSVLLPLAIVVATTIVFPFIPYWLMPESFLRLLVICFCSLIAVSVSFYLFATNKAEKEYVSKMGVVRKLRCVPGFMKERLLFCKIVVYRCLLASFIRKRKIWLFLERGCDAQDNAWHLFKYVADNYPEIRAIFAIRKSSLDFKHNLAGYEDKVVQYDSLKYYFYLFCSRMLASTHLNTMTPSLAVTEKLSRTVFRYTGKVVFLQHGIIHNDHSIFHYPQLKVDLFIAGAKNEYDLLTRLFNQPPGVVHYTGLARFDNLRCSLKPKRQILIMPTWRNSYIHMNDKDFVQTDYFKQYSFILSSAKLRKKLEETDYELVFYNHIEFQKFNGLFASASGERVKIGHFGEKSVQDLLKESVLLVTDYSSIYYDFFYMQKPIVFFKLNRTMFEGQQYGGDFDNPEDFGQVTDNAEDVVRILIDAIERGCVMEDRYVRKMQEVFVLRDQDNCKRIFQAMEQLDQ